MSDGPRGRLWGERRGEGSGEGTNGERRERRVLPLRNDYSSTTA